MTRSRRDGPGDSSGSGETPGGPIEVHLNRQKGVQHALKHTLRPVEEWAKISSARHRPDLQRLISAFAKQGCGAKFMNPAFKRYHGRSQCRDFEACDALGEEARPIFYETARDELNWAASQGLLVALITEEPDVVEVRYAGWRGLFVATHWRGRNGRTWRPAGTPTLKTAFRPGVRSRSWSGRAKPVSTLKHVAKAIRKLIGRKNDGQLLDIDLPVGNARTPDELSAIRREIMKANAGKRESAKHPVTRALLERDGRTP